MIRASIGRHAVAAGLSLGLLWTGCAGSPEPEIVAGVDACAECQMVIDRPHQASGYVHGGEFVTFDSPVCLLRSFEALRQSGEQLPREIYFADYRDGELHPADGVGFLLTDSVPTVMGGAVLAFADRETAAVARSRSTDQVTDWNGLRLLRGEPDRILDVRVGPNAMFPEVVNASKGDLLVWRLSGGDLEHDLELSLKGYPEVGTVIVPAAGQAIELRMWASRPGAGFPVMASASDQPLGMLKVEGAHTDDEEAM